jgi:anti-sigma factor RsiW
MTDHDPHVRTELGAYVLGALEPAERLEVEAHLEGCESCSAELARLSALPPLLDRLRPDEALADHDEISSDLAAVLERSTALERQRLQRQVVTWRAVAAAALAAVLVVSGLAWAPWESASEPDVVEVRVVPASELAAAVEGTVSAYAWEWGTTVEVRVADLPPADAYALWAVAVDGRRERAGTWGPTGHGGALVRGASAIQRDDLARVEVTDVDGAPLFAAEFGAEG